MRSLSRITVRYAETDQMGIAHHSEYPVWYEVARTDLIKKLGLTYTEMEQMGVMLPLSELQCRYKGVARYEDELTVVARISGISAARITFSYEVYKEGEEKPVNTGSTTHGFVDSRTFRPLNMKKKHPELYNAMENIIEKQQFVL